MSRFLLVSLNIEAILQETTLHRRREKLGTMKNGLGLGYAYDATIGRIKAQEGVRARLGMETLMWISHSERPLNVDEICHALAVEIGSTDINTNNVPSIRTVLSCCQGLAVVDEGSSTIRLIHFTLKEYLSRHADLFDKPHSNLAETCLTYLNFQTIKNLSANPSRDPPGAPFLEYSSLYWGTHMRMGPSDRSRSLALDLLGRYDHHISAKLFWASINKEKSTKYTESMKPSSALHCVSYFGIAEVAIDLIRTKRWDVNQQDSMGLTPLMWAARHGREEVVKLLLRQKHTRPDMRDMEDGRTALAWAAGSGHEGVVKLFLDPLFANPGRIGRSLGTPQAMGLLFGKKYVNPDRPDNGGRTPFHWAAGGGHDGVVKLLLEREDVSPDRPDHYGRTPLSQATGNGRDGVVRLLLKREDVSPDRQDNCGRTPLQWAAGSGHDGVVTLLLGLEDVSPDKPDNSGRTPLSWAAGAGHDGAVELLLGVEDVGPDRPDNNGRTPLSWAAENGHDGVMKLLLGREDVNADRPDNDGRTPLSWAPQARTLSPQFTMGPLLRLLTTPPRRRPLWTIVDGNYRAVKLLLERKDVNPDKLDNDGRTPLSWAAEGGHDRVVELLLGREDVNPDRLDNGGRTPLSWVAESGYGGVVELLLGRQDVSPDKPDNGGRTPLSWAAQGRELLPWCAKRGRNRVVELLLGREDVSPDRSDNSGRTPLHWAAGSGHDGVVELLLGREDVSPDKPDNGGRTPLNWAAGGGYDGVVELLLRREDVSPDRPDDDGRTPLHWAAQCRHDGAVKLLLGREDVNPDRLDNNGRTPRSLAPWIGGRGVRRLLKAGKTVTSSAV